MGESAGLAALAALSPTALLLVTVYLNSARPGRAVGFHLAGALVRTVVMGVVVLIALRAGGLSIPQQPAAAVQVIATSRASDAVEAAALAMVVVIDLVLVWLPLVVYLIAPDRTVRALKASNAWIRANRHALLAGSLTIIGAILDDVDGRGEHRPRGRRGTGRLGSGHRGAGAAGGTARHAAVGVVTPAGSPAPARGESSFPGGAALRHGTRQPAETRRAGDRAS